MANFRMDRYLDENAISSRTKPGALSARNHTVRKHAFSELNNVIHNQKNITPFKSTITQTDNFKSSRSVFKPKSFCNAKQKENSNTTPLVLENALMDEFSYWDIPSCTDRCHKTDQQIWTEMNMIDNNMLNQVIQGGGDLDSDFCIDMNADLNDYIKNDDLDSITLPQLSFEYDDDMDVKIPFDMPDCDSNIFNDLPF